MDETAELRIGVRLAAADLLTETALRIAGDLGVRPVCAAVVDLTGEAVSLRRADGAMPMTARLAIAKARTSLLALRPSRDLDRLSGPIADSAQELWHGDFVPRPGGLLLTRDQSVLGAVGVSGARMEEDEQVAAEAIGEWQGRVS